MVVNGLARSVAVGMVVNGVLRTLWVISHRMRFMDVCFKTAPKGMLAFRRVLWHAVWSTISSRVRQHAALTGIDGSLTGINVEKPACEARSKKGVILEKERRKSGMMYVVQ